MASRRLLQASKNRFGPSSEKTPEIYGQCHILGKTIENPLKQEDKVINIKEHKRSIRKKGDREKLIKSLPHEVVECVLEDGTPCEICGNELVKIGKKKVRSEMEYIPASFNCSLSNVPKVYDVSAPISPRKGLYPNGCYA